MSRLLRYSPILLLFATPLLAGEPPAKSPDTKPALDAAPLGGPKLTSPSTTDTGLVRRSFEGKVERLDQPPELAALAKLTLDKPTREKLDAIVFKRARVIDDFVADNLPMLNDFQAASANQNKAAIFKLLGDASKKLDALWKDGPLEQQCRALLPMDQQAKFDKLVGHYWDAVVAEHKADPTDVDDKGKPKNRLGIMIEERLKSFGKEIELSFYRVAESGELIYRYLFKDVDLTGDQPAQVRTILADFSRETKLAPTKAQGEKLFRDLSKVLDADQRKQVIDRFVKLMKGK
ncbi:MAG: hypothetical protein ACREJO_10825 [Phycisphaerales bacterium]